MGEVTSTNDVLKKLAADGAPEGTVVIAHNQTAGRGTHGRQFCSHAGKGLYLSLLLRPKASLTELLTLTGWAAVAAAEAIRDASGAPCAIKWLNDITLNGRKVCGILTELPPLTHNGAEWAVVGFGVNLTQTAADLAGAGLEGIAASLGGEGYAVSPEALTGAILDKFSRLYRQFPHDPQPILERYRALCTTTGKKVRLPDGRVEQAVDIDETFALKTKTSTLRAGGVEQLEE